MAQTHKVPPVEVLKAIDPSVESVREHDLRYKILAERAGKHAVYETTRQTRFFDSEDGSLEEQATGKQLALQYFLMTARKLNEATTGESKQLWSERFTQATSEIYGQPEAELARELGSHSAEELRQSAVEAEADPELLEKFNELSSAYGLHSEAEHGENTKTAETARNVGNYLQEKYQDVFTALQFDEATGPISAEYFASQTEQALSVLAENHDAAWSGWKVKRDEASSKLSVAAAAETITVGAQRVDMRPLEAKGLFAHEVLVHGQRGLNGKKLSDQLGKGLPGYLDSEEGLGVFVEYAVTGNVPEKNIDRYVDIALALGMVDGKAKTRQELLEFAGTRALLRNEIAAPEEKADPQEVMKSVYAHVNRIYRGSLGNEYIGVFTKDIAYQKGFMSMGAFIENALAEGQDINEVMEYLVQAKFDPLNESHVQEIERARHEK